jgi:starch phosphorylase
VIKAGRKLAPALQVVFIPNYNMEIASLMTSGVDVWLNTPTRPREASGTSGMKCAHNGVLNFSVLDGWWIEGWLEEVTGWSIGPEPLPGSEDNRTQEDVEDFYNKLERRVIPTYVKDRSRWVWMMKNAIALNASVFNTHRLVREYCEKAYGVAFRGL